MEIGSIILFVVLGIFILLTIVFLSGRGTFILNGLGFKSVEELKRFNPKKMIKFLGYCMVGFDIALLLMIVAYISKLEIFAIIGAILIFAICIGGSIYIKSKQRFLD